MIQGFFENDGKELEEFKKASAKLLKSLDTPEKARDYLRKLGIMKLDYKKLETDVYTWPTKYEHGFTAKEIKKICNRLGVKYLDFCEKLGIHTAMVIDGETITYPTDVLLAITLVKEGRDANNFEFD